MKRSVRHFLLAMIVVLGITKISFAATYYLSSSGSDSNNGTSLSTPWKTITKLNAQITNFPPGTRIFFRRGDTFSGQIDLLVNGNAANKIIFDAYGSGANPIISANIAATNWTVHSGNIWKTQILTGKVKQLFENNKRLNIARYPDTGFLRIDVGGSTTSFKDAALTQANGYFVGANVVMQTVDWAWEYTVVTNSTATGVITYATSAYPPDNDVGYFFTNKLDFITLNNEWYYDTISQYLYLQSSTNPNTKNISASLVDYGIKGNWGREYISVNNIDFTGQNEAAIWFRGATCKYLSIDKCNFSNQNKFGIQYMGDSISAKNCIFSDISGQGIDGSSITRFNFSNNTFLRIGLSPGLGSSGTGDFQAIKIWGGSNGLLKNNRVDSIGYAGITANVDNTLIEENDISNVLLVSSDGSGLYSWGTGSFNNTYRKNIINNILGNSSARPAGGYHLVMGLYMDNNVYNVLIDENTIYNVNGEGIRINAGSNSNTIKKNTTYKCKTGICYSEYYTGASIYGNSMRSNVFYANFNNTSIPVLLQSNDNNFSMLTSSDSNYFCNPFATKVVAYDWSSTQSFSMSQWRTTSNLDANSKISFYQWPFPTDNSFILVNPSNTSVTHNFSNTVNLDNNIVNSITLLPYTSKVLIGGNITTSVSPINEELQLHVFPNPSHDFINYESNDVISQVIIYDSYGRLVQQFKNQTSGEIDIRNLGKGIYYVELMSENKIYRTKVIKQ